MEQNAESSGFDNGQFLYPLEERREKLRTPFEKFIHRETTSGIFLGLAVVLALILANTGLVDAYTRIFQTRLTFGFGPWELDHTLTEWINEFLMVTFFFVVGLEIKHEMLIGELSDVHRAALPVFAALGGMIVPACIFALINHGSAWQQGWGIPMATDIAFCVGALVLLGNRVPRGLSVLLLALAIVDDLGAVVVIALFYTTSINLPALGIAALLLGVLLTFNISGNRRTLPYLCVGILLWLALMSSGVHATIAGVLVALCVPARPRYAPVRFNRRMSRRMQAFNGSPGLFGGTMLDEPQNALVGSMKRELRLVQSPLQRMLDGLHSPVSLFVIPLFALANAGIPLDLATMGEALAHPVTRGIIFGLVAGKFLGITGFSWIAVKTGLAKLPDDVGMRHVAGMGLLGGIGFTMSIFIADLSFPGQPEILVMAKTGIFAASLLAGILGCIWLSLAGNGEKS